jgi:hypothetical protein
VCVSIKRDITRRAATAVFSNVVLQNGSKIVKQERENKKKDLTHVIFDKHISFLYSLLQSRSSEILRKTTRYSATIFWGSGKSVSRILYHAIFGITATPGIRQNIAVNKQWRCIRLQIYSLLVPTYNSAHKLLKCLLSK